MHDLDLLTINRQIEIIITPNLLVSHVHTYSTVVPHLLISHLYVYKYLLILHSQLHEAFKLCVCLVLISCGPVY